MPSVGETVVNNPSATFQWLANDFITLSSTSYPSFGSNNSMPTTEGALIVTKIPSVQIVELGCMLTDANGEQVIIEVSRFIPIAGRTGYGIFLPLLEATFTAGNISMDEALGSGSNQFLADQVSLTSGNKYVSYDNAKYSTSDDDVFGATAFFDCYGVQGTSNRLMIRLKQPGSSAAASARPFIVVHGQ